MKDEDEAANKATSSCVVSSFGLPPSSLAHYVERELDGQAILCGPDTGNTYYLNETALAVWRRCDGVTETRKIAAEQCENFEVDFETALDHVEQLVALFTESGLLESGSDS
jgi:hypothetical protein